MPEERDEYGGVAIDVAPQVDEYGGQLVPERTMLPEVPRVPEEAGAKIMGAGEPLLTLPGLEATDPRFQAFLTGLAGRPPSMRAAENIAAAVNVAKTLPEFLTSPLGAATAPIAAAGGLPSRLLGLGFAGQMAAGVPEAAREAGRVSVEGTPQEQKEALLGLGANIALPAALAAPALARRGVIRPAPEEIRPAVEPAHEARPIAPPRPQTPEEIEFQLLHEHWLPRIKPWRQQLLREEVTKGQGTGNIETNFLDSPGAQDVTRAKRYYELARKLFGRTKGEEIQPTQPTPKLPSEPTPPVTPLTAAEQASERARLASELGEEPEPPAAVPAPTPEPTPVPETPVETTAPAKPESILNKFADKSAEEWFSYGQGIQKQSMEGQGPSLQIIAEQTALKLPDESVWQAELDKVRTDQKKLVEELQKDPSQMANRQTEIMGLAAKGQFFDEGLKIIRKQKAPEPIAVAPPEPPKVARVEASSTEQLYSAFKAWDEGTDPNLTERDLLDRTEFAIENNPDDIPGALKKAAQSYRDAIEEDFEMAGRGDVEPSQERFMSQLEKFSKKSAPTTYTGSDAIEIVGKPLGEWFKAKTAADLPKGTQRVELAGRIRAKSTKPKDILSALKNEQDRIRRVVTEMAKPPLSPEEAIPMVQPTPVTPTATETTPPVPAVPTKAAKPVVLTPKGKVPPNSAIIEVVDYNGRMHAKVVLPHDGTPEGAIEAAKKLRAYADQNFEWKTELYHTNTRYGATDASGNLKWVISPNAANIAEVGTPQARYILGDLSAAPSKVGTTPPALPEPQAPTTETPPPTPEVGPGPIGMGGAAAGEIQATGPRGEPTHGIAARVLEQRRQQGVIAPVEPGEGISPQESIERGRQLLAQGVNPEKVLEDFNLTKAVSAEGIAVVRAQGERLARTAYAMADAHGIHSREYEAAWEADSDWAKRTKPMQTEWHKIGQAQQGETEIDTGTFHGLRKAFLDATGKDFTPKQAKEAEGIAKGVKEATEAADKAKADVFAEVGRQARTTPETKPTAPKPEEIATPDATTLWKRAKAMIDAGEDDFDALRHKLATEFGVPVDEVTRKLAEPKSAKKITDDMYRKMAEQRRMVSQAKAWLKNQQVPGWLRFMRSVPRIFFTAKILGHGTVGMITHAGLNIFNPVAWRTYWPNFFKQYRLVASKAYHERMMQDLLHDPLFTKARRSGLANDPFRFQDDYQTPTLIKWLDRIGITGNRGFDALKLFRQARFNQIWSSLPDTLQTPEYAKLLADSVNHSTGVIRRPFREWSNWTFFAPRLEASRWAWMVKDPWDAAKTFVDWNKASPAEKAFAMSQLKEKAVIAGTYYSLLMMNQGLLSASGSDQRINFDNPRRGDFLAFKAAGHNIGIVGPMLGMVRLFANLYHAAAGKRGKVEALTPRAAEFGQIGFEYARGKLSPFAGFGVDVVSQADFQGRPMPYSSDAVPKYLRRQGLDRYTYGEYAAQEFTPIPVSEAVREVWHDQGMGDDEINAWLKALTVGVAAGSTGARVSAETPPSTAK